MGTNGFARRVGVLVTITAAIWVLHPDLWAVAPFGHGGDPVFHAAPSPWAADALLENQWHLKPRTQEAGGVNARAAWSSSLGAGIVIGIVDDGLQYTHPDLAPNYLASASWDFNQNDSNPSPIAGHGTAVAGIAAARGDNTIGVSGVAPQASLAGLRLTYVAPTDSQEASAFGYLPDVIDILNNSWNPSNNGMTLKGPGPLAAAARQSAATTGRSGKGRVFVWSAGDGRLNNDDCNFDGYANSRFAIAVGASDDTGYASSTTERCAALMVMAPSGLGTKAITTTDLIGTSGYDASDYTSAFGTTANGQGTAAAATVSGAAALMLARNPSLTWRDVQHILRRTSIRINPTDPEWTIGQYPHSQRLGFGLLDVNAAVALAGTWTNVPAEAVLSMPTLTVNQAIPDSNQSGLTDAITIASTQANFVIEHVEVDFTATHPWRGDLTVTLTSPSGVTSSLATIRPTDSGDNFSNWTFGSVRHWGESAAGAWTLNVADRKFRDTGTWDNWTLRLYGYRVTPTAPGSFAHGSPANGATGQLTSPTLSWSASVGAASYEYCIDTVNDGACNTSWVSAGSATSVALSGLANNTVHYWQVRAINTEGTTYADGSTSSYWAFTTVAAPPGAFSHNSPGNGATGQSIAPTLSWTASTGASSYEYCIDTSNNSACNATWISTGGATSVSLTGLANNTSYSWHVRATGVGGTTYAEGSATTFWGFTTVVAAPGAFGHISPANGATGQSSAPTLSWGTSSGATSYEYCYDTTNDNACSGWTSASTNTSIVLSGLASGTPYYWQVRATNAGGTTYADGASTAFWKFTTLAAPAAFSHSSPANGATGQSLSPTLSWTASTGATGYEACIDTTNDNACSNWTSMGANTSVGLNGLTAGTSYYWHVRAINGGGTTYADGSPTSFWSFTTVPAPTAFSHSSPANGATGLSLSPTLSWATSSGATSYEYCYDTTNDSVCSGWTSTGVNTSVALSNLTAGATYYWQVRAINSGGTTYADGSSTTFWSFTTLAAPGAFTHDSPANGATGQLLSLTVSWGVSAGAVSYEYCYDSTNDGVCAGWTSTGANTSVGLSGLAAGTTYYWQIRALNPSGTTYADGSATSFWNFTTLQVPGAFAHSSPVSGAAGQSLSPTLSWTASSRATSYEYCIDTSDNGVCNASWVPVGNATTAALSSLAPGTMYSWQVRAVNAGGMTYADGSSSTFWSFTTLAAPLAFSHSSPANGATGQSLSPTLSWTASTGATSYEACIDTTNDNACSNWTSMGANTSVGLNGLTAGTSYYWHVRAINGGGTTYGDGSATAFWSFTTVEPPAAFSKAAPNDGATGVPTTVTLNWTASTGAASYEYCVDTTNDGDCTGWSSTGTDTSVELHDLNPGTPYFWHVRANNAGGTTYAEMTSLSGVGTNAFWSFTTQAMAAPIFDLNGDGLGDALTYNPVSGAWARQVALAGGSFAESTGNWGPGWSVLPATFNTDGLADAFIFNATSGEWFKMLNTGSGFTVQATSAWWPGWQKFVMDLDGDGLSDLFLYDLASGQWYRALSTPTGFTYDSGLWSSGWEITPMKLNADAFGDLFLMDRATGRWFWVTGQANGSFEYPVMGYWQTDWAFYPGDFNGDGLGDWFLYRAQAGQYYVAMNSGTGYTYANGAGWAAGWTPMVVDWNADGQSDLLLYNKTTTGQWYQLQGDGAGQFAVVGYGWWNPGWDISPTDFNADRRTDLLFYQPGSGLWYQALNLVSGTFDYTGGFWQTGLTIVVGSPIR